MAHPPPPPRRIFIHYGIPRTSSRKARPPALRPAWELVGAVVTPLSRPPPPRHVPASMGGVGGVRAFLQGHDLPGLPPLS